MKKSTSVWAFFKFELRSYVNVCQSYEAIKFSENVKIWKTDPIDCLCDERFTNKVKYFKQYKLFKIFENNNETSNLAEHFKVGTRFLRESMKEL